MKVISLVALAVVVACTDRTAGSADAVTRADNIEASWQPGHEWRLSVTFRELGAPPATDSLLLYEPVSAYRDPYGRYVVADGFTSGQQAIIVFDSMGRFVRRIGRRGRGPGEFRQLFWALPYRGDSIMAYDFADRQLTILDSAGAYGRDIEIVRHLNNGLGRNSATSGNAVGSFGDGSLLLFGLGNLPVDSAPGTFWAVSSLFRVDPEGSQQWDLGTLKRSMYRLPGTQVATREYVPFGPEGLVAVADSVFYDATSDTFEIRMRNPSGRIVRAITRPYTRRRIAASSIEEFKTWSLELLRTSVEPGNLEAERQRLESIDYPSFLPAISDIRVDSDGNLWVEEWRWFRNRPAPRPEPSTWSVFDASGRWLGSVLVPAGVRLVSIGSDHVIGLWNDSNDVVHLYVYSLIKPDASPG